jgi:hypothetical protein
MTHQRTTSNPALWVLVGGSLLVLLAGVALYWRTSDSDATAEIGDTGAIAEKATTDSSDEFIAELMESEELILTLTPYLSRLASGALNLQLPGHQSLSLFEDQVTFNDLATGSQSPRQPNLANVSVAFRPWGVDELERTSLSRQMELWRPLLDQVEYFEHAKFYFVRGEFLNQQRDQWEAKLGFEGMARMSAGHWSSVKVKLTARWIKQPAISAETPADPPWRIAHWHLHSLQTLEGKRRLFAEVLDVALPDTAVRQRAQDSVHERILVELHRKWRKYKLPHKHFDHYSRDRQPALSIVDIDRDGFDDLYVMARWGKNLLLRNRGDGTFEEIAAEVGLDIEDHCSCALFADFDNDGDADLFLGRTLRPSMYLVNENGNFVDASDGFSAAALPQLVSSISAADYNGDGLLDVYISTYASTMNAKEIEEFLPKDQRTRLWRLARESHDSLLVDRDSPIYGDSQLMHSAGPPNVLLVNQGKGKFDVADESKQLAVWRHTFQSTWGDFDNDGDADLYVCSDYSDNNMFLNEGEGTFRDVTEETGTADIGFGMGAAWGDYDNDNRQDLYVSNMFSKAGRRITAQVPGMDRRLAGMSRGNTLFRNAGDRFEKVSGLEPPALQVEKAGWAWGGQFVDIDNDGYLDIYSLSGFYTAPSQFAIQGADY